MRLTKTEVDEYINKYYRSLYGSIKVYCMKRDLDPSDVISKWYIRLLSTNQTAEKCLILSRKGLGFFAAGYFADNIIRRGRKFKKNLVYVPSYEKVDRAVDNKIEEQILTKELYQDLYDKAESVALHKHGSRGIMRTFKELMTETRERGSRQASHQRRKYLIFKLREAYGIKYTGTTDYSRKTSPRISSN